MNIERIAQEVAQDITCYPWSEPYSYHTEFLRRCLSKLAEQAVEPVVFSFKNSCGEIYWFSDTEHSHGMIGLYTESQLIAAQQRTAEACAKFLDAIGHPGCELLASAILNGEWREYL